MEVLRIRTEETNDSSADGFLDEAVEKYGDKIAFEDAEKGLTYRELKSRTQFFAR